MIRCPKCKQENPDEIPCCMYCGFDILHSNHFDLLFDDRELDYDIGTERYRVPIQIVRKVVDGYESTTALLRRFQYALLYFSSYFISFLFWSILRPGKAISNSLIALPLTILVALFQWCAAYLFSVTLFKILEKRAHDPLLMLLSYVVISIFSPVVFLILFYLL